MSLYTHDLTNMADVIDVRNLIERIEELDELDEMDGDDIAERAQLSTLLDELKGNGGDHEWLGDWYPVTLIRDTYWVDYTMQYADDIASISDSPQWPYTCIDWNQAARELQMDYTSVDYDGMIFWYR